MKILFLTRLFYPHIGGVEKHVWEISKRLINKGHDVTIIAEKHDEKINNYEVVQKIRIYRMSRYTDNWFKKFFIWWWMFKNRKLMQWADVIHCHDVFFWYLPFRFLFPKKPIFTTFHGYEDYPIPKKAIIIRKISELLSWGNICIGEFIKKWYGTKPSFVTYGGVDVKKFSSKGRPASGRKVKKRQSAVFFGRLDSQTSVHEYIKAYKEIKKVFPTFTLHIIGDGPDKKNISPDITVEGFTDKPYEYLFLHHFAFVSRYLSILEAMVAKRLIFAIHNDPIKEDYLKMTPFKDYIVIGRSAKEIARKVMYYLAHPQEEKTLTEKAYIFAKKQTWDRVVTVYLGLWKDYL